MSLKRHASYNVIGAVLPALVALITIPLYLPTIGTERFGALSLIWLIAGSFGFFDLGLTRSTAFRIASLKAANEADRGRTLGSSLAMGGAASVVAALIAWGALYVYFRDFFECSPHLRSEILRSLPLGGLLVAATLVGSICNGALQGRERFLEANILMTLSSAGVQAGPLLVALVAGPGFIGLIGAMLAIRVAALAYGLLATSRHVASTGLLSTTPEERSHLRNFGKWVMTTSILGPIILYIDRLLLGAFQGGSIVAAYHAPFQLAQRLTLVPTAIATAMFPRIVGEAADRAAAPWRSALSFSVHLVTPPVILAILAMDWFMAIWVGDALPRESADVAELLLAAFWFNSIGVIYASALEAQGRPHVLPTLLVFEFPIYLAALILAVMYGDMTWVAGMFAVRCAADSLLLILLSRLAGQLRKWLVAQTILVLATVAIARLAHANELLKWELGSVALVLSVIVAAVTLQTPALSILRWVGGRR